MNTRIKYLSILEVINICPGGQSPASLAAKGGWVEHPEQYRVQINFKAKRMCPMERIWLTWVVNAAAANHYVVRGRWELNPQPTRPYPDEVMWDKWRRTGRKGKSCTSANLKFRWVDVNGTPWNISTGEELCALIPRNESIVMIGDSLTRQFVSSWQHRLLAAFSSWKVWQNYTPNALNSTGVGTMCPRTSITLRSKTVQEPRGAAINMSAASSAWQASDVRLTGCAERFPGLSPVLKGNVTAIADDATLIVVNCFAHLNFVIGPIERCYRGRLAREGNESSTHTGTHLIAVRDVLRAWRIQISRFAAFLGQLVEARRSTHRRLRVVYRTSPPAADPWPVQNAPMAIADMFDHIANYSKGSGPFAYSHEIYIAVNEMSCAAFLAAGLECIDMEDMMGGRVDAHTRVDRLHFCQPGVVDYALDELLRTLYTRPAPLSGNSRDGNVLALFPN